MSELEDQQATLAAPPSGEPIARPRLGSATVVPERYEARGEIGRGGMGSVEAWSDPHIGREVAAKILLDDAPGYRERFLHEARTQGSLAHPAIVPVHDLAFLPDGRPFFTMQRVHGVTLAAILTGRAAGNELARFSMRKLLEALARIALAVDYAHQRDVVHRDLKPANLMLGEFGEVYVLDWGIARRGANAFGPPSSHALEMPLPPGVTAQGTLLGTPGYMAPEQARGGGEVDARTDVYALGCVLFEVLAQEPLHVGARVTDLLLSTLSDDTERSPARRATTREVPPELDALCLAATHPDREHRLASARQLAEGIERYLEGDRDDAARAAAAERHAERAEVLSRIALGSEGEGAGEGTGAEAEEARRHALYEVGRAMAFSPGHRGAVRTLVALLTEPPRILPHEVKSELEDIVSEHVRVGGRIGAVAYGIASVIFFLLLLTGLIQWATGAWLPVVLFGIAGLASWGFSRVLRPTTNHSVVMLVLSTFAITSLSTVFSPFFGVPTAVCVNTMLFVLSNEAKIRYWVVPIGALGVLLPIAGELLGLTPPSYRVEAGTIVLLPRFMDFTQTSVVVLVFSFVLTTVISALALGPFRDDLDREQKRSRLLSWQLRQFVPSAPTSERPPSESAPPAPRG